MVRQWLQSLDWCGQSVCRLALGGVRRRTVLRPLAQDRPIPLGAAAASTTHQLATKPVRPGELTPGLSLVAWARDSTGKRSFACIAYCALGVFWEKGGGRGAESTLHGQSRRGMWSRGNRGLATACTGCYGTSYVPSGQSQR